MNNKFLIFSLLGLVASTSTYFFMQRQSPPPDSDEFFRRNPHLTRISGHFREVEKKRENDEFLEGDYLLERGITFPVTFHQELMMSSPEKELVNISFDGKLTMHSFGIKNKKLVIIVDYYVSKISEQIRLSTEAKSQVGMGLKGSSPLNQHDHQIMAKLDPSGKLLEVWSTSNDFNQEAMEIKVMALNMLFKKLPELKVGALSRIEGDERGVPYPISYNIVDAGDKNLLITGQILLDHKVGSTPEKAAAAGAPAMSLIALKTERDQSFKWLWNTTRSHPVKQDMTSELTLKFDTKIISSSLSKANTVWAETFKSTLDPKVLERFKFSVDFKSLLGRMGERLKGNNNSTPQYGRSNQDILHDLSSVSDNKMSDTDKEKLFIELAHAVKENPDLIEILRERAMNAAAGSREVSMILGALGYEASPWAQTAMVGIFNRAGATLDEKQKVVTEFTLSSKPLTPESKVFLKDVYTKEDPLASDVSGTAGLALGSSISKDGDPGTVSFLRSEWSKTESLVSDDKNKELRQAYLLTVMGNSKSDAFLPQVEEVIDSSNVEIRSAAVNSLRFAQDEKSRDLLFNSLEDDANPEVRVTAAQSLLYQPFDQRTLSSLQNCADSSDPGVKFQCYRVLSNRIEQPGVKDYLSARAASEIDPQIKTMLNSALLMTE